MMKFQKKKNNGRRFKSSVIFFKAISKEPEIVPVKPVPPRPPREPAVEARQNPPLQPVLDPWRLFPEQKRYYLEEFSKLQKEEGGLLAGLIAREFFLKSKLSREELMLIWEMADLDQDGKLTKLEFCLAFHLTNVRRNGFPLPHAVPESLFISLAGKKRFFSCPNFGKPEVKTQHFNKFDLHCF